MAPGPTLGQRAEDVLGVFSESFSTVVGMGVGMAPDKASARSLASACGIEASPEFWMLYGDLERAWVKINNEKKPDE